MSALIELICMASHVEECRWDRGSTFWLDFSFPVPRLTPGVGGSCVGQARKYVKVLV